jgi:phospholipid-binding lipoprotein MlaA
MYTFDTSLFAEDSTASKELPVVNESGDRNSSSDTDEDIDYVDISMDATPVKDSLPTYNRAVFAFNDKLYYYLTELTRLVINSTIGGAGFTDPAKKYFHLELQDEDFGQTLGHHGNGTGSHLELPFFGPSNVRDAFGLVVDLALDPVTLLMFVAPYASPAARTFIAVNDFSIDKGDTYEGLVEDAIDPYIAVQDAYAQNREKKVKE